MESDSGMRLCNWFAGIDFDPRCLTATLGFTSDDREPRILGTRVFGAAANSDSQALIRRSLPELGRWLHLESGDALREIAIAVPGNALQEYPSSGECQFGSPTVIDSHAINLAMDRATAGPARLGQIVQTVIRGYEIDGRPSADSPIGSYATSLRVQTACWVARVDTVQQVSSAIAGAGFDVGTVVPRAVAAAHSTLTKLEQRDGAMLVMIGEEVTECATFIDSGVVDVFSVPLGSRPLEEQIARACNISPDVVKRLDLRLMFERMPSDPIVQRVRTVLSAWGTALFTSMRRRMDDLNLTWHLQAGVVIAGSARKFPDLDEQAARVVGTPARFATAIQSNARVSGATMGSFVTLGLIPLQWKSTLESLQPVEVPEPQPAVQSVVRLRETTGHGGFGHALGRWLREFVPASHYSS